MHTTGVILQLVRIDEKSAQKRQCAFRLHLGMRCAALLLIPPLTFLSHVSTDNMNGGILQKKFSLFVDGVNPHVYLKITS